MDTNARRDAIQKLVTEARWPAVVRAQYIAGKFRFYVLWSNDAFVNIDEPEQGEPAEVFAAVEAQLEAAHFDPLTGTAMGELFPEDKPATLPIPSGEAAANARAATVNPEVRA